MVGKVKEPARVAQADCAGYPWYVSRRFNTSDYKNTQYLHGDGIWREQTWVDNRYSGLFQNRDEALRAIANFESREAGGQVQPIETSLHPNLAQLQRIVAQAENRQRKGHGIKEE